MQSVKIDKISTSLPDDILVEILIRVPVQTVLQCRRVCKHLRTLTSTPDFIHNHFLKQQSTPSIVIAYRSKHQPLYKEPNEILYINDWGSTASGSSSSLLGKVFKQKHMNMNNRLRLENVLVNYGHWPSYFRLASYCNNGLLLFSKLPSVAPFEVKSYVICNPVTQEKVELNINEGYICACFYHPLAKEYRLIWGRGRMEESNNWMFKIINLGGKVFSHTIFAHHPSWDSSPPVVLSNQNGGLLHWMIADTMQQSLGHQQPCCEESIIVFNASNETFSAMPHPGDKCTRKKSRHRRMRLLELKKTELSGASESLLCLCDCSVPGVTEMWVLEDYEKRVWIRRHKIIVAYGLPLPFGLINGELLFHDSYVKGVLAYNINNKTMRKINYGIHPDISDIAYVSLHPMSLVSFTKLICIARYNLSFLE